MNDFLPADNEMGPAVLLHFSSRFIIHYSQLISFPIPLQHPYLHAQRSLSIFKVPPQYLDIPRACRLSATARSAYVRQPGGGRVGLITCFRGHKNDWWIEAVELSEYGLI